MGSDWIVTQREQELLRSAADDLPMLGLADDVSHLLVEVIEQVTVDASQQDRTADDLRRHALWFMAIITVRAMRSAMRVLAIGYEEQSVGYQRLSTSCTTAPNRSAPTSPATTRVAGSMASP